jgi:hypothetical protein
MSLSSALKLKMKSFTPLLFSMGSSFGPGLEVNNNLFQLLSHVWHGVINTSTTRKAQDTGRCLHLVEDIARR